MRKYLRTKMVFGEIDPQHQILTIHQILEGICEKKKKKKKKSL